MTYVETGNKQPDLSFPWFTPFPEGSIHPARSQSKTREPRPVTGGACKEEENINATERLNRELKREKNAPVVRLSKGKWL